MNDIETKSRIFIGIDPGKTGAVAILHHDLSVQVFDTPESTTGMADLLYGYNNPQVFVEKVHAMPGQGVVSMFSFGENYGKWQGIIAALGYSYSMVAPQTWKKELLKDMPKEKESSIIRALQLFPGMSNFLSRKKDHNRAEALLIAEYGHRLLGVEKDG